MEFIAQTVKGGKRVRAVTKDTETTVELLGAHTEFNSINVEGEGEVLAEITVEDRLYRNATFQVYMRGDSLETAREAARKKYVGRRKKVKILECEELPPVPTEEWKAIAKKKKRKSPALTAAREKLAGLRKDETKFVKEIAAFQKSLERIRKDISDGERQVEELKGVPAREKAEKEIQLDFLAQFPEYTPVFQRQFQTEQRHTQEVCIMCGKPGNHHSESSEGSWYSCWRR